jgi:branched-chain amino acid transport system substrate-binding protein
VKALVAVLLVLVAGLSAGCGGAELGVSETSCGRVLYEGEGKPDVVVVSDLPLRGVLAQDSREMVDAIELVVRRRNFTAGAHRVGYQSCNDSVGNEPFDPLLCRQNARAYARSEPVIAVVGPFNSGCALEQIPIVSRKSAGPLAMVSPNTDFEGLTRTFRGGFGASLYPDGLRSFARLNPQNGAQGAAAANLALRLGARRAVVLHQGDARERGTADYSRGITLRFLEAANALGLSARTFDWRKQKAYGRLASEVAAARPDVVFLAGLTEWNAKRLVEDIRAAVGPGVPLIASNSFAFHGRAGELGSSGEGLYVLDLGVARDRLPVAGRRLLRALGLSPAGRSLAPEAAQATEVLLDAIARSDGTRASVVDELHETKVENGILGSFSFDRFGDMVPASVSIYRVRDGRLVTERVVRLASDDLS